MSSADSWAMFALAAVPSVAGSAAASAFQIPTADYLLATGLSVIGIAARHAVDAGKEGATFRFRVFGIDLLTAPMLGIASYTMCLYMEIGPLVAPGFVVALSYAGPELMRQAISAFTDAIVARLKGGKP